MMSFPNREDSIKRPVEGLSRCKGAKVASSISASKRSGNASCEVRGGRSTDDGKDSITLSEERVLAAHKTVQDGGELHSAVSMHGGTRIRRLELFLDSLYQCAKADRQRVFHSLHDKLCSMEILAEAWRRVASNNGVAGIDSETIGDISNAGAEQYLSTLQQELIDETYTVECVRRVYIPKPNGKQRPLGIPTVRDRIVQQAVKLLIEPIFEADFQEFSYGYRPNKSAQQASQEVYKYLNYGLTNIIDIDIEDFFGTIDHDRLISFVMERISDPYIIKLIREWLRAGVVYNGETTYPDMGTPQGGVISPLLANIYLNRLDTAWKDRKMDSRHGRNAHLIRYADDMCVLTDKEPSEAMAVIAELTDSLD
ncbi:MAG: group II intron reverse transcriptase/maturase [Candidatus Thermoplasmatota archaeon]|nr:group II intron reverse transcriptase/maturase [Candidatus Thermoplasmatota archaeon]